MQWSISIYFDFVKLGGLAGSVQWRGTFETKNPHLITIREDVGLYFLCLHQHIETYKSFREDWTIFNEEFRGHSVHY